MASGRKAGPNVWRPAKQQPPRDACPAEIRQSAAPATSVVRKQGKSAPCPESWRRRRDRTLGRFYEGRGVDSDSRCCRPPVSRLHHILRSTNVKGGTAMIGSHRLWLSGLTVAAIALWPASGEAQTMARTFEEPQQIVRAEDTIVSAGWFERAAEREVRRLKPSTAFADSGWLLVRQPGPEKRSWIGRHPALFGALVGFAGGFLIGYLPGDDGVFDDFTAGFNGWVMGGIGAGTGATVGAVVGLSRK